MIMRRLLVVALAITSVAATGGEAGDRTSADAMRAHVEFLASDRLEGRETGLRGYEIAADYVASRFRATGLKPAVGDGWFQQVPLGAALVDNSKSSLIIAGKSFANRKDVLFGPARTIGQEDITANVVFAGYGIDDPKAGQDDYKGLDVRGKIVATLFGFPKGMRSDVGAHYGRSKAQMASARGAIGVITIRTRERERTRPWAREMQGPFRPMVGWTLEDGSFFTEAPGIRFAVTLHDDAAGALFAGAPVSLASILAQSDRSGGRPKGFALKPDVELKRMTTRTALNSPNVIGVLPGSDPKLSGETVLLMAHLDHLGVDASRAGDQIFNGAMDNAGGVASLLEAARALAASPTRPRRTILFAAVTGEEHGLVGSDYLARHPVPGAGKIVAVVNLDMPVLLYDFKDVVAFGAEHSTMGPAVARAGASLGVTLSPDPLPSEGLFTRSDHYSFVRLGVPSIFLMTGFQNGGQKVYEDFLRTHYHQPSDDLSRPFNWDAAARFARINMMIAAELANADAPPAWYDDSFFGKVFAPDAAKAQHQK